MNTAHSVSHSQGAAWCRTDGLDFDPDVIRLITYQPNGGNKANETLSQFKPRPSSPDRLGGSTGSLVLALPMGIVWGVSAGTTRIPFFECSTVSLI